MIRRPWDSGKQYKWYIAGPDGFNIADGGSAINIPIPMATGNSDVAGKPLQVPQAMLPYYNVKPINKYEQGGVGGINVNVSISSVGGFGGGSNKKTNEDNNIEFGIFEMSPMSAAEIVSNWDLDESTAKQIANQLKQFESNGKNAQKTKDRQYILPSNVVKLQKTSLNKFWSDNNISTQTGIDKVLEFMSVKNNAIAKAFQETGGKGLAGVIDSLSFDWNDNVLWEIDQTRKAPMRCKVTFTFSPIHDISPGLDNSGANRAPIYPVGPLFSEIVREKI
jgi:hypothetical protein